MKITRNSPQKIVSRDCYRRCNFYDLYATKIPTLLSRQNKVLQSVHSPRSQRCGTS